MNNSERHIGQHIFKEMGASFVENRLRKNN
jgi:hypothetical protein